MKVGLNHRIAFNFFFFFSLLLTGPYSDFHPDLLRFVICLALKTNKKKIRKKE